MTRAEAWKQAKEFAPRIAAYAKERNRLVVGHENVSQLSPAIRHRLLGEQELADFAIAQHGFRTAEKFVQEVYWRLYWKSWLEMRPSVWRHYREDLGSLGNGAWRACERVMSGHSGIEILDAFADELVTTGYLHNHARMWFAGAWIHHFGLPWQIGAEFFHQHLLDGDPASNTLSWRWVAGLHTRGKTYLARAANIRKNVDPEWLEPRLGGLEQLKGDKEQRPEDEAEWGVEEPSLQVLGDNMPKGPVGLWIHEDDFSPETSLTDEPVVIERALALVSEDVHEEYGYSGARRALIASAAEDAARRQSFPADVMSASNTAEALGDWATDHGLHTIMAFRPWAGPLGDQLPSIQEHLVQRGIDLLLVRRPTDCWWLPKATAGFFTFWKKACRAKGWAAEESIRP